MPKICTRSSALLCIALASSLLTACGTSAPTFDAWTGTTTLDDGTRHALRLEVRDHGGLLAGNYYVDAARGDFHGTVDGDVLTATLTPSDACRYTVTGTLTSDTIGATFTPDACPDGQTGTWSLARR